MASPIYACIWKCKVVLRIKVFAWLLFTDRLNTKEMLKRRHWNIFDGDSCVLCPLHVVEDWRHLFFLCNFSVRVWNFLQIEWESGNSLEHTFFSARKEFRKPFFTEVVLLAVWNIWKQRNEAVFRQVLPSFTSSRRSFVHEATMHMHRLSPKLVPDWSSWLDNLH